MVLEGTHMVAISSPSCLCILWSLLQKAGERNFGSACQHHPPPPPTPQIPVRNDIKLQESRPGLKKSYSLKNGSFLGFLPPTPSINIHETATIVCEKKSPALKPSCSHSLFPQQKYFLVVECFSRDSGKGKCPKTHDSLEPSLFQNEENQGETRTIGKIWTRCSGTSSDRKSSTRNWVPWSPQLSSQICTLTKEGLTFTFPAPHL